MYEVYGWPITDILVLVSQSVRQIMELLEMLVYPKIDSLTTREEFCLDKYHAITEV